MGVFKNSGGSHLLRESPRKIMMIITATTEQQRKAQAWNLGSDDLTKMLFLLVIL